VRRLPRRDPPRWTEVGADSPLARRAADLLRLPPPPPLGPVRSARIQLRLASHPVAFPAWWRTRYGVAAALLTAVVAAAGAAAATGALDGWLGRAREIAVGKKESVSSASTAERRPPWHGQALQGEPPQDEPSEAQPRQGPPAPAAAHVQPASPLIAPRVHDSGSGAARSAAHAPSSRPAPRPAAPTRAPLERDAHQRQPALVQAATPSPVPVASGNPPPDHGAVTGRGETSRTVSPADPAPEPAPDSEARLVSTALAHLHGDRDGASALVLLAEHRRRFPSGALALEARVAEVQALLLLERRSQALEILDHLPVSRLPRGAELAVLRAELRAEAQRCREALTDFELCADSAGCRPEAQERALYGRASCRSSLGQNGAARGDLERYLERFPRGRFAGAAARALGGTR
jgi:hypothetical protein